MHFEDNIDYNQFMDVLAFISSINKISLIAFFITGALVIYELYIFKQEINIGKNEPKVPNFKERLRPINSSTKLINEKNQLQIKKNNLMPLLISSIVFICLGIILFFSFMNFQSKRRQKIEVIPTPIINFVASSGIKIYNNNWIELNDSHLKELAPGKMIYIGIETVSDENINKARIKVNKKHWDETDITIKFNKEKNVFYREYLISTNEAFLKIEGQLHSKVDGWLGE